MSADDLLAALPRAKPTHHHSWRPPAPAMIEDGDWREWCMRCGKTRDPERSRRGRTARRRGNDYEREVAHRLGGKRVGQYGGREDIVLEHMVIQAKNGGAFPERLWKWLEALPHDHRLRAVVVGDAPGKGNRRRELIVLDLADYIDWYGT